MKILEIHIYGYGKLENVVFRDLQDIQVFYGENEAGKSTIMSFIHSILFGFPTKQQNELRYEPKKGSKYGGQLVIQSKKQEKIVIERVKGKAVGDVSVFLEDGTVGGEELLQGLLSNIDKFLYQSIFSFNLHGLQNVHQLKSEDLGKFLFSTSTIGTDRLLTVENMLQKEIDLLYKPAGKKPYINEKLQEMKSLHEQLKKAKEHNGNYGRLLEEKVHLKEQIQQKQKSIQLLQAECNQLEEWKKLAPIVKEKELLGSQLNTTSITFPIDGLSRLAGIQQQMKPLEAQLKILAEKKEQLQKELEQHQPNKTLIEKEASIRNVLERLPLYDTLKEETGEWEVKKRQVIEEIEDIKGRLHFSINEEKIAESNTSIFMKDKTAEAEKKQARIKERKIELDEQFTKEKDELERIEVQIALLKDELLPEPERAEKKQKLQGWLNRESIVKERQSTQDKLHLLQMTFKKEKERMKQNNYQYMFLSILFICLAAWGISQSQWVLALIGAMGICFIGYLLIRNKKTNLQNLHREIQQLKDREQSLNEQLKDQYSTEITLIEEQLKRDAVLQEQLTIQTIKWEQQNSQYDRVIRAYEIWEREALEHEEVLLKLGEELVIPDTIALSNIHSAFLLVERLKECLREYQNIQIQIEKKLKAIKHIEEDIQSLDELFIQDHGISLHNKAFILREQITIEIGKRQKYEANLEKYDEVVEQLNRLNNDYALLAQEKDVLFQLAEVDTEEEFRFAGKEAEKAAQLAQRVEELSRQIKLSSLNEEIIKEFKEIVDIPSRMDELTGNITMIMKETEKNQQTLADIKHQIALVEEGGIYGRLLHKFRQLQSELEIEAKEWAKLTTAKEMLRRTVERFKDEYLPSMLKKAEEYLCFLTEGNYVKMYQKGEGAGFLIERKDHTLFDANELSQATTEQAYMSLRIALATTIYKKYPFPIIIDDSFVNFDHVRTRKVIELLKNIEDNQILFFTCHQHLLTYFTKEEVIKMKESASNPIFSP